MCVSECLCHLEREGDEEYDEGQVGGHVGEVGHHLPQEVPQARALGVRAQHRLKGGQKRERGERERGEGGEGDEGGGGGG